MKQDDPLLNEFEVAEYLTLTVETLRTWRRKAIVLPFVKIGNGKCATVRYRKSELDAYLKANTVQPVPSSYLAGLHKKKNVA